ncbi:COX15/CtaA family protein [Aliiglaciecola sp. CAU 1673]|uniref:COX15/CtaA family protein n=1 Tax=Aliiglaciecola sp. CAU 1673 TaxID=3032595 RepID=UPI0023DB6357|nr:COX15/CtaA family protein [Aliiglaciecola sp. CAU 1673]MDF2179252.1 COX15/CtaA family protein [Aliiglaciecola sp. CAU 1673]
MRKLVLSALVLALVVIMLGAYTRLTDAGLGCPDWPGCYGFLSVPKQDHHIAQAQEAFPERPLEAHKAWNEMIHRYFAGTLGLVILVIALLSLKKTVAPRPLKLPLFLLLLVIFQAALGMWTVTMNLMPLVVMGHLLGGFSILACLFLLYLRLTPYRIPGGDIRLRRFCRFALVGVFILVGQIALGGWVSANYAALACTELPLCQTGWSDRLDFAGAFSLVEANSYEFGTHDYDERMTMHIVHRIGALITFAYLAWLALRLYSTAAAPLLRNLSVLLLVVLTTQVSLGVANVLFSLPLAVAVAHNAVAALLLLVLVMINYSLFRKI